MSIGHPSVKLRAVWRQTSGSIQRNYCRFLDWVEYVLQGLPDIVSTNIKVLLARWLERNRKVTVTVGGLSQSKKM